MRRTTVLIAATLALPLSLVLAGCGAGAVRHEARSRVSGLCVDVGLPLTGTQAPAGHGVLDGVEEEIPAAGLTIGGYRVRICDVRDDASVSAHGVASGAVLEHTRAADGNPQTIAYIGEISPSAALTARAVLGAAGIPLLTPSGPTNQPVSSTGPARTSGSAATPVPIRVTTLYLLPAEATQASAVTDVRRTRGCVTPRRGPASCAVLGPLGPGAAPFCTGIPAARRATLLRYCVMAGPNLASAESPAVAYGESIGEVLVTALRAVASGGGDVGDRATVMHTLLGTHLARSPIGPVRFDGRGAMQSDEFTSYTVETDGSLVQPVTFHTH